MAWRRLATWHHPVAMLCPLQTRDIYSVTEKGTKDPGHLLQALFQETQIKDWVVYQFVSVPNSQILARRCRQHSDPSETATRDAKPTTSAKTDPSTDNSCVASSEKRFVTATATRRKVSFSHVRMKARNDTPRSSKSRLQKRWAFAQPTRRDRVRDSIPVTMID